MTFHILWGVLNPWLHNYLNACEAKGYFMSADATGGSESLTASSIVMNFQITSYWKMI